MWLGGYFFILMLSFGFIRILVFKEVRWYRRRLKWFKNGYEYLIFFNVKII